MFGSTVLDVAVGVIFVYLILSMICSAANELIVSILKSRSKVLKTGVSKLLAGMNAPATPGKSMTDAFYCHPFIESLARKGCLPSYIPARNFAMTVLDLLVPATGSGAPKTVADIRATVAELPAGSARTSLLLLIDDAESDMEKLKAGIETWFNDTMNRVSGWYKYHTQWRIFIMGLFVAIILNVDTFNVAGSLYRDGALRNAVSAAAAAAVDGPLHSPDSTASIDSLGREIVILQNQLKSLDLPIGWPSVAPDSTSISTFRRVALFFEPLSFSDVLKVALGWLLTALAISLGAPFWFDLLGNIANVRIAGKRPNPDTGNGSGGAQSGQGGSSNSGG